MVRIIPVLSLLLLAFTMVQAQNCPELSSKEWEDVQDYGQTIISTVLFKLHAVSNDSERHALLDSLETHDYNAYTTLQRSVNSFIEHTTPEQQTCFYRIGQNYNIGDWIGYIYRLNSSRIKTLSPEFQKGWGVMAEINQGALNPFQGGERYFLSVKGLVAYTFAKEKSGGHVRALVGPTLHYSNHKKQLFLTTRVEVRLKDIRADPVSLGTIKFIGEASSNPDGLWVLGPGVGVELPNFGIQALYEWETERDDNHFELGISYRFLN